MNLIQRATNITLNPTSEWQVIEPESTSISDLFKTYIMPLSAIPLLASFVGMTLIGMSLPFVGHIRTPITTGLTTLVLGFVLSLLSTFVVSLIINALAPSFGGEKNSTQALKVTAYAFTPMWIAGVLNAIPMLGMLTILAGIYSIYVLYLGLPVLMKASQDKAVGYTVVSVICSFVLMIIIGSITSAVTVSSLGTSAVGSMMQHNKKINTNDEVTAETAATALKEFSKFAEKMEAAKKEVQVKTTNTDESESDTNTDSTEASQPEADTPQIKLVDAAKLKALFPDSIAGLKRIAYSSEKSTDSGYEVAEVQVQYSDSTAATGVVSVTVKDFGIKLTDSTYDWLEGESESEFSGLVEKTGLVNGRQTHETTLPNDMGGEYSVVVAGRFIVEAVSMGGASKAALKAVVDDSMLNKLEALKNEGIN